MPNSPAKPMAKFASPDLGSRNGTLVNGQPITERLLQSGDQVSIGPFVVTILSSQVAQAMSTRIVLADGAAGRISTLKDMPRRASTPPHLTTLTDFNQQLLDTADPAARAVALCRLMVGSSSAAAGPSSSAPP